MKSKLWISLLGMMGLLVFASLGFSDTAAGVKPYIDSIEETQSGMTLWQIFQSGGLVVIVLILLSMFTTALIAYNFMTVNEKKTVPDDLAENVLRKLAQGDEIGLRELCGAKSNIIAHMIISGLEKRHRGEIFFKDTIEKIAKRDVADLWRNISYLADIATISPLIGLLGTVLGMIQAFHAIAFQTAMVKPILLAGGISKAMVSTAGGLVVAIPALIFYSYFRGKVQEIAIRVDNFTSDLIKTLEEGFPLERI